MKARTSIVLMFIVLAVCYFTISSAMVTEPNATKTINDEISAAIDEFKPKYYPRLLYVSPDTVVYNVYNRESGSVIGSTNTINNSKSDYTFDWDTGEMITGVNVRNPTAVFSIRSGKINFKYSQDARALIPAASTMSVFDDTCKSGQTVPRPLDTSAGFNINLLVSMDNKLNQNQLPGIHEPGMALQEYGICRNGQLQWEKCKNDEVYVGAGRCMSTNFETHRCLNHFITTPNVPVEFTDHNNPYNYYKCETKHPYATLNSCPTLMQHDGTKCTSIKWCYKGTTPMQVPDQLRDLQEYKNSYISCDNPENPVLFRCKNGLRDDLITCNETYHYSYIYSEDTYDIKPFRIGRSKIDDVTKSIISKEISKINVVKEFVYKNVNRSLPGYDKTFDMYIEYKLPEFYFDEKTGERKTCMTFRDCPDIYKFNKLRIYSPALLTYLKFCSMAICTRIDLDKWISTDANLSVSYSAPAVLTEGEKIRIDETIAQYPGEPIYASSIHDKNILYKYDLTSNQFVLSENQRLREDFGYITNTFYDQRSKDTRIGILKSVSNVQETYKELDVIQGKIKYYENSFGYTFRKEITPDENLDNSLDSDCKSSDKVLQNIIKNVQNSVVINNSVKQQPFCVNGKKVKDTNLPCSLILGLTLMPGKNNCIGFENIGPTWLTTYNDSDPKKNKYTNVEKKFNELNINANIQSNDLLISTLQYSEYNH